MRRAVHRGVGCPRERAVLLGWSLVTVAGGAFSWRVCDVTSAPFQVKGSAENTASVRAALSECDEVTVPKGRVVTTGPVNLTSNQVLRVDGTLLASNDPNDYPIVLPVMGYGWSHDQNCFPPDATRNKVVEGKLRYAPIIGAYNAHNVTITGSGVIDGNGDAWWSNCTRCHYPPHNQTALCERAGRPKLIEAQFVNGFYVLGTSDGPNAGVLTLRNSPFWTVTPSYTRNIHVSNLKILAPMNMIGNTDGVNLDSCRDAVVENLYINNSDDGVSVKSGIDGYGLNLAIPTENVLVRNITCPPGGRGGLAIGSEMSGGIRNITFRDCSLHGERGIHIKTSPIRGGYIDDITFENIDTATAKLDVEPLDGAPFVPGNHYLPIVSNIHFINASSSCSFDCAGMNRSKCFNLTVEASRGGCVAPPSSTDKPPPQTFGCKDSAMTLFGAVTFPWPVCVPLNAPVNLFPTFANYGPTSGQFATLAACQAACGHKSQP
eukprot:m.196461 g.196461  ORF g.196461 m.196461 type:complete len:490 (+) comp19815_c0_seq1:27-1496(+)